MIFVYTRICVYPSRISIHQQHIKKFFRDFIIIFIKISYLKAPKDGTAYIYVINIIDLNMSLICVVTTHSFVSILTNEYRRGGPGPLAAGPSNLPSLQFFNFLL